MNILCLAPHPDDEVLACGGLLRKAVQAGSTVTVVFFAAGWSGTAGPNRKARIAKRESEARAAAQIIGIRDLHFLRLDDGQWQPSPKLARRVARLIRTARASLLLIPHSEDGDDEHRYVSTIGQQAAWMARTSLPRISGAPFTFPLSILAWELWQPIQRPQLKVDISGVRETVEQAFRCYHSQQRFTYWEWADSLHRYRGGYRASVWVEAYQILRLDQSLVFEWFQ